MRYAFVPLAFGLGASAAILPRSDCCFQLTSSGGVSGSMSQLSDGQNRVGGNGGSPATYCINNNGAITDSNGRGCILTGPTTQFQCDSGASPTPGFSISSSGEVEYNGSSTFYACPATDTTYNIYTQPVEGQSKCVEISLSTGGKCSSSGSGSGSSAASTPQAASTPAASAQQFTPAASVAQSSAVAESSAAAESSAPLPYGTPSYSVGTPVYQSQTVGTVYSTYTAPAEKTTVVQTLYITYCPESETAGASTPAYTSPVAETSAPAYSSPVAESSSPAYSAPAESSPVAETSAPAATTPAYPAPQESETSFPAYSAPAESSTVAESSAPAASSPAASAASSTVAESTPAAATTAAATPSSSSSSGTCPTNLAGDYQYPHLLVPVNSTTPNTAYGTQYFGTISSTVCSTYNFDIPTNYTGLTCTLEFLFPLKSELETSDFTVSGSGEVTFSQLSSPVSESTTYDTVPSTEKTLGTYNLAPGNSYVIQSGECKAGQTIGYEICGSGSFYLHYFQDWNPSPIGLFERAC